MHEDNGPGHLTDVLLFISIGPFRNYIVLQVTINKDISFRGVPQRNHRLDGSQQPHLRLPLA